MISKLSLQRGRPISNGKISVCPLTLSEIEELGEVQYQSLLSAVLIEANSFLSSNNITNVNYDTDFDLFIDLMYTNEDYHLSFLGALSLFTRRDFFFSRNVKRIYIKNGDDENASLINFDEDDFLFLRKCVRLQNYLPVKNDEGNKIKVKNRKAQQIREKIMKKREESMMNKNKSDIDLHDIVSIVASYVEGINILNVWELTVYQLYESYARLQLWDNYHIMQQLAPHLEEGALKDVKHWSIKVDQSKNKEEL